MTFGFNFNEFYENDAVKKFYKEFSDSISETISKNLRVSESLTAMVPFEKIAVYPMMENAAAKALSSTDMSWVTESILRDPEMSKVFMDITAKHLRQREDLYLSSASKQISQQVGTAVQAKIQDQLAELSKTVSEFASRADLTRFEESFDKEPTETPAAEIVERVQQDPTATEIVRQILEHSYGDMQRLIVNLIEESNSRWKSVPSEKREAITLGALCNIASTSSGFATLESTSRATYLLFFVVLLVVLYAPSIAGWIPEGGDEGETT